MRFLISLLFSAVVFSSVVDPYEIFAKNTAVMKGSKDYEAEYLVDKPTEKLFSIHETYWQKFENGKIKNKRESVFNGVNQVDGRDGDSNWRFVSNVLLGPAPLNKLTQLIYQLEEELFKEKDSKVFKAKFLWKDFALGQESFVIQLQSKLFPEATVRLFYSTKDFMLLRINIYYKNRLDLFYTFGEYKRFKDNLAPLPVEKYMYASNDEGFILTTLHKLIAAGQLPKNVDLNPPKNLVVAKIIGNKDSIVVPFKLSNEHIFVPVKMGTETRWWMVDSGWQITSVNAQLNACMQKSYPQIINEYFSKNESYSAAFSSFEILSKNIAAIESSLKSGISLDLTDLGNQFGVKDMGGIIGANILSQFVVKVDYAKNELIFFDQKKFSYKGEGFKSNPHKPEAGFLYADVSLDLGDKKIAGIYSIDLGSGFSSLSEELSKINNLYALGGVKKQYSGANTHDLISSQATPVNFNVGTFQLNNVLMELSEQASTRKGDGNLGYNFLKNFVVYLDYKNNQIILEKGENFNKQSFKQATGMYQGESNTIEYVQKGSLGEKLGFKIGDKVVSINGINLENLSQDNEKKLEDLVNNYEGKEFKFGFVPYQVQTKTFKVD